MLLSVSRRTDVPAFFADWFYRRLREGYVLVRNPRWYHQVARISLSPEVVDGIAFWTKNPAPMLDRLRLLDAYPYYFHVTCNAYGPDIEARVPRKGGVILPAMRRLSDAIGPHRVIWRYDPVLCNESYTEAHHLRYFEEMAKRLEGVVDTCVFGFIDESYKTVQRHLRALALTPIDEAAMHRMAKAFAEIAGAHGIALQACSEPIDFSEYGIGRAHCVDKALFERIGGYRLALEKDKNQRRICSCAASVDIGAYNTCGNACQYCYANYDERKIPLNTAQHDPASPLLVGQVEDGDEVYDRRLPSNIDPQVMF